MKSLSNIERLELTREKERRYMAGQMAPQERAVQLRHIANSHFERGSPQWRWLHETAAEIEALAQAVDALRAVVKAQ